MRDLARNRVRWLAKQDPTNIQMALHQEGIVDWEGLAKWMQEQFVADIQREILGHPMIVFIVVFKAMMRNPAKKSFQAIIVEMIDNATNAEGLGEDAENPLSKLMQYITSLNSDTSRTSMTFTKRFTCLPASIRSRGRCHLDLQSVSRC